jgi:GNAT superfamily N-acetyltransferase
MPSGQRYIKIITGDLLKDVDALELVWTVFSEFEAPEYTEEGIKEFQSFIEYNAIKKMLDKAELLMWGCFEKDKVIGAIAVAGSRCHINLLFVDKQYHKQGIARELYHTALQYYRVNSEYREITVNSSPYAASIYRKLGFVDTNTEQLVNGLRFVPMKHTFR